MEHETLLQVNAQTAGWVAELARTYADDDVRRDDAIAVALTFHIDTYGYAHPLALAGTRIA